MRYYHRVLEAKLVLADNIVISLDTEYIENENENVTKQDCEINKERGTGFFYNHLERNAGKKQVMNLFEYRYETEDEDGKAVQHKMMWIINIDLTKATLNSMVIAERGRWKIENEGFNTQKNILYKIQHLNSRNRNAMKNHYLLTQISDTIMQLYLAWDNARSTIMTGFRNMADWIRECFRKQMLTDSDLQWIGKRTFLYL